LCGYETWFLALREEFMLKIFENNDLRVIFDLRESTRAVKRTVLSVVVGHLFLVISEGKLQNL
jgi:hypothetical protein